MIIKNFYIVKKFLVIFIFSTLLNFVKCNIFENFNLFAPKVKVSIIIPAYNTGEYITRCLKSALNQSLKEIEVIVINDNSTDNTLEIINKFKDDKRLKLISLDKNVGPGSARNIGIDLATGEFLGFMDSDDFTDLGFFEFLYKYSKGYDLVGGIYVDSTNLSNNYSHHGKKKAKYYGNTFDSIWRRKFVNEHHIRYPNTYKAEDVEFRQSFMKANPRVFIAPDEGIYYYYKRRVGSTMNFSDSYIKKLYRLNKNGNKTNIEDKIDYLYIKKPGNQKETIYDLNFFLNISLIVFILVMMIVLSRLIIVYIKNRCLREHRIKNGYDIEYIKVITDQN